MTRREALHHLLDEVPEEKLDATEIVLRALAPALPYRPLDDLEAIPLDDEPDNDDPREIAEALAECERGEGVPHEEVKRRWGIA